jgi:hypothetical protein
MSGFDPHWLALREPADNRARNGEVLAACSAHYSACENIAVVDLGCGAGSNLRALAPHLPQSQAWRLVDHDPALLDAAKATLLAWADAHAEQDGALRLQKGGKTLTIDFVRADLANDPAAAIGGRADLVTAAALFDLTSERWMRSLCALLALRRAPLYAVLTYDGVETWTPPHAADIDMLAAFHAHQKRDKGFGPAAGPDAAAALRRALEDLGYVVRSGASDWTLDATEPALVAMLASGVAGACRETGLVDPAAIDSWLAARKSATARIGHVDLFASPP